MKGGRKWRLPLCCTFKLRQRICKLPGPTQRNGNLSVKLEIAAPAGGVPQQLDSILKAVLHQHGIAEDAQRWDIEGVSL